MLDDKIFHDVLGMQGVFAGRFTYTMKLNYCYRSHEGHRYVFQTYGDSPAQMGMMFTL